MRIADLAGRAVLTDHHTSRDAGDVDDALWHPEDFTDLRAPHSWGPPVPPSFLGPDDLAAPMTGAHSA